MWPQAVLVWSLGPVGYLATHTPVPSLLPLPVVVMWRGWYELARVGGGGGKGLRLWGAETSAAPHTYTRSRHPTPFKSLAPLLELCESRCLCHRAPRLKCFVVCVTGRAISDFPLGEGVVVPWVDVLPWSAVIIVMRRWQPLLWETSS